MSLVLYKISSSWGQRFLGIAVLMKYLYICIYNTRIPCAYWTVLIISLQLLSLEPRVDLIPTDTTLTNTLILSDVPLFMVSMFHDIVFLDPILFMISLHTSVCISRHQLSYDVIHSFQRMC